MNEKKSFEPGQRGVDGVLRPVGQGLQRREGGLEHIQRHFGVGFGLLPLRL